MSNRVTEAVKRKKLEIERRINEGLTTQEKVDEAHRDLDMEFDEFAKFQELKSFASLDGVLSIKEAQSVYGFLGETPEHFNGQPVEVKAVLTGLFGELLERRIVAVS